MLARHAGLFSSPLLLQYLLESQSMQTESIEAQANENHQTPAEHDPTAPPIDQLISKFDDAVNKLRQHAGVLKPSGATSAVNDCLECCIAMQAFMREVRRLFGDIL